MSIGDLVMREETHVEESLLKNSITGAHPRSKGSRRVPQLSYHLVSCANTGATDKAKLPFTVYRCGRRRARSDQNLGLVRGYQGGWSIS
jgi:hypothetical protein